MQCVIKFLPCGGRCPAYKLGVRGKPNFDALWSDPAQLLRH